jgi:hypothetical protein
MPTAHDDLPHPVPPIAYLRWKENWFFIAMDPVNEVYGVVHFNFEPGFDRARYSCRLSVRGKLYQHTTEAPFPAEFAFARAVGLQDFALRISGPPSRFELAVSAGDFTLEFAFDQGRPIFDFASCRWANPDMPSFQEVMTLGTNLPYNHQQQAMRVLGSVRTAGPSGGELVPVSGYGYRDHSWCVRSDAGVASHLWCAFHFGDRACGVKEIHTQARPAVWAREGYVTDGEGERVLRSMEFHREGSSGEALPAILRAHLKDLFGRSFTVHCDVANRYAQVPLLSEKPGKQGVYHLTENFCPCRLEETGAKGCALVEIGFAGAARGG